ncbi:MAG: acyltransferase family protein, partial [bacterium]|nr:acyltransferase family protein [bacterium]
MKGQRNTTIDFLRGLAVLLMMLIHVTAYFLSDPIVRNIWDYTHIVVPLFIFCSGFIFFQRGNYSLDVSSVIKRIKQLILPYY